MKNPNLIFALTVILLMFFGMVSAQDSTAVKPDRAARMAEAMKKRLKLDDDQSAQVTALSQETVANVQAARAKQYTSQQAKRSAFMQIRKTHSNQLKEILSDAQWSEYLVMRKEMRARLQQKKKNGQFQNRRMMARRGKGKSKNSTTTISNFQKQNYRN